MTIDGMSGTFTPGEQVAQKAATYGPGLVYANTSNRTIEGLNTAFVTNLTQGDRILITYGTSISSAKTGTVSGNTSSDIINGSSTTFTTDYAVGDYMQMSNSVRQILAIANNTQLTVDAALSSTVSSSAHYGVTAHYDIAQVTDIVSASQIEVDIIPTVDSVSGSGVIANYQKVVGGVVSSYNSAKSRLTLKSSTAANTSFLFTSGRSIVGGRSQAQADIVTVDNIGISYIEPHVATFVPPATSSSFTASVSRTANGQIVTQSGEYGISNKVPFPAMLKSRSNEVSGSGYINSFTFQQRITSLSNVLSPLVDLNPGSVLFVENVVDNYVPFTQSANTFSNTLLQTANSTIAVGMSVQGFGIADGTVITNITGSNATISIAATHTVDEGTFRFTSNDHKSYGISKNRYISKRLALADGLDAEDIRVFTTAYKPEGSEIEVYAKILNGTDAEPFNDKNWSKLVQVTNEGLKSDSLNPSDVKEFEYTFASAPAGLQITGTGRTNVSANAANVQVTGFGTEFNSELVEGDFVKLIRTSDASLYDIRRVATITNATALTLDVAPSFTADGITIEKVTEPLTAFKYALNDGIVRYYTSTGSFFDTYKYMAIKIVLRSTDSSIVPTVQDVRAVALSI